MFDRYSDFALNKLDRDAIVCKSVTGDPIRLTRESFATEEEFKRWKAWSDADYHKIQKAGRQDDDCLSLEEQLDALVQSAEEAYFAPFLQSERMEHRAALISRVRNALTEKQYRRLRLYYLDRKSEAEIAAMEGVGQQRISKSLIKGAEIVEKFFKYFFAYRG